MARKLINRWMKILWFCYEKYKDHSNSLRSKENYLFIKLFLVRSYPAITKKSLCSYLVFAFKAYIFWRFAYYFALPFIFLGMMFFSAGF